MGGTVGIEAAKLEALDYETVKASGIAFGTAHNALQRSLTKAKSINVADDQTTIHFLAIRQLSHNLKNQKVLERTRHRVLKTRSLPRNVKYRKHSFEYENDDEEAEAELRGEGLFTGEPEAELDHDDLDLVHDDEYHYQQQHHQHHTIDDGPPWSFSGRPGTDKHAHTMPALHLAEEPKRHMNEDARGQAVPDSHVPQTAPSAPTVSKDAAPVPAKGRKPRPVLSLQLTSDVSNNALPMDSTVSNNAVGSAPLRHTQSRLQGEPAEAQGGYHGPPKGMPPSPSANVRVSPRGTLYMGRWKVMETGIVPDESLQRAGTNRSLGLSHGGASGQHLPARLHSHSGSSGNVLGASLQRSGTNSSAIGASQHRGRQHALPALGGKRDFIEINTLGSGASGVVSEAIHLPSLTIVALKMLPVYNQEKRQHVSRELGVLYKNLAELRLVDDSLYQDGADGSQQGGGGGGGVVGLGGVSSPHILSLYNAFVDPRSGMINLVIEYMDGGSLEDLVQQGGCRDEKVLADIAYQTAKGLCFLHAHKSVHRDIKPANILCSTSGLIKIGDFGISKALDKTSGFANSFVGTVSYMSPERITGESYSFSCDVWSLGLTLLAVAKGRFPLNTKEGGKGLGRDEDGDDGSASGELTESTGTGSPQHQQQQGIVGGAAGYWAMIKAICDDEPPRAGPAFSPEFNAFIAACLQKDPAARRSSKQLLGEPFIERNATSLKMSLSDLQAQSRKLSKVSESASSLSPQVGKAESLHDGKNMHNLRVDTASPLPDLSDTHSTALPSPLTTRLTNAAITRRTSRDYPGTTSNSDSPSIHSRKVIQNGALSSAASDGSGKGQGQGQDPVIPEDGPAEDGDAEDEAQESANDVIMAIRLEHLDRVLERIAHRITTSLRQGRRYVSASGDPSEDGVWDDGDDDGENGDVAVQDDPFLQPHDSIDSMDRLLQYKGEQPSPDQTVQLQLPPSRARPQNPKLGPGSDLSTADAKEAVRGEEGSPPKASALPQLQPHKEGDKDGPAWDKVTADRDEKHTQSSGVHGILKTSANHHSMSDDSEAMRADEKKAIFVSARGKSSTGSAFNSSRSVHFSEGPEERLHPYPHHPHSLHAIHHGHGHSHSHSHSHGAAPSIAMVAEGVGAEGDEDGGEGEAAARALTHPTLPKTSSYFVQTRVQQLGQIRDGHDAKGEGGGEEGDADSDENDALAVVDHAIAVSEAVAQAAQSEPPAPPVDYRRMLPKLNSRGLCKWENLARQLHLPLHLVKLAVRSKLGALVDLEAEEEEGEEEEEDGFEGEGVGLALDGDETEAGDWGGGGVGGGGLGSGRQAQQLRHRVERSVEEEEEEDIDQRMEGAAAAVH